MIKRRTFLYRSSQTLMGMGLLGLAACDTTSVNKEADPSAADATTNEDQDDSSTADPLWFGISLAQWSLHNALFAGDLDHLDFAATAKNDFGITAIEYVNAFFKDKAKDMSYLREMNTRAADHGVRQLLIMIDSEGHLGDTDASARTQAIDNHKKWVEAAKFLGCHSIRVNAAGEGSAEEVSRAAIDGLRRLSEFAQPAGLNVIVENHGGYSSDGAWLANVIQSVGLDNCGTLPDFGNFCVESGKDGCVNMYDRYQGVKELMPYAKAVSAKSYDFAADGNDTGTDFQKMLAIVKDAGYTGFIGIEYEGQKLSEAEGIKATKALLEKAGRKVG